MKKISLKKYTDFLVKETETLLNIDSPTGYTENAAAWVLDEFTKLGFDAKLTNKGGVLVSFGGSDKDNGLLLEAHVDTLGGMVAEIKALQSGCLDCLGSVERHPHTIALLSFRLLRDKSQGCLYRSLAHIHH